jgi:hypothetical protein
MDVLWVFPGPALKIGVWKSEMGVVEKLKPMYLIPLL